MPTVGLEEAFSDKLVSPTAGNVSTAGGMSGCFRTYEIIVLSRLKWMIYTILSTLTFRRTTKRC